MKSIVYRSAAFALACMVALSALAVPSFATDYQSTYNFWNWAYDNSWFLGKLISGSADNVCSVSEDSLHHASTHSADGVVDGEYTYSCTCDYCGQTFKAVATDLEQSYEEQTPDYTIDDEGVITGFGQLVFTKKYYTSYVDYEIINNPDNTAIVRTVTHGSSSPPVFGVAFEFTVAVDCVIHFGGQFYAIYEDAPESKKGLYQYTHYLADDGSWKGYSVTQPDPDVFAYYFNAKAGETYRICSATSLHCVASSSTDDMMGTHEVFIACPDVYYTIDTVTIDGEPITGGGTVEYTDETGNRQYIENQFFDQSTNTYYSPVTNTTYPLTGWEYDYGSRTYTGYTENGEVKIVYGDECMTLVEGGNTYNYYYASPDGSGGSGSGGSGDGSDDGDGIGSGLGELLGSLLGGLIDLITGLISGLIDSLINLVEMTIEKLGQVVNLFGEFGNALKVLWSWLPDEIITILAAGVSVVIFASVLKLFV